MPNLRSFADAAWAAAWSVIAIVIVLLRLIITVTMTMAMTTTMTMTSRTRRWQPPGRASRGHRGSSRCGPGACPAP